MTAVWAAQTEDEVAEKLGVPARYVMFQTMQLGPDPMKSSTVFCSIAIPNDEIKPPMNIGQLIAKISQVYAKDATYTLGSA